MHSVYLAFDHDGVCLYVGRTSVGERRLRQHGKAATWWPRVHRIDVVHVETREEAAMREYECIRMYAPEFNVDVPTRLTCPASWTEHQRSAFRFRNPLVELVEK